MRSRQSAECGTANAPTRSHRELVQAWRLLGWRMVAWHIVGGWHRTKAGWRVLTQAWRAALTRHPALRFAQIIPLGLLLWALDDAASFRAGAAVAGLRNAVTVNSVSLHVGGEFGVVLNDWLAVHHLGALAATWYYIVLQGALTGVLGALLIWRRVPSFPLHRNALIAVTALGLLSFWCYPVAPPRLLPGYHDIVASALPAFSAAVEPNGSATYASLPSLHVAWAVWAAIAGTALVRRPALRALLWLYPAATVIDVLATANHYVLDAITAIGLLFLGYVLALAADRARLHRADRRAGAARGAYVGSSPRVIRRGYGGSSPQVIHTGYGGSSPRVIEVHGAVLAGALPATDFQDPSGHAAQPSAWLGRCR